MLALRSCLRPPTSLFVSYLLVLSLLLLITGCAESESGTAPPPYTGDAGDTGDTGDTDPDAPPADCDLPSGGLCDGTSLHYCEGTKEKTIDCGEIYEQGRCAQAGLAAQCQVPVGAPCVVDDEGTMRYPRCLGHNSACLAETLGGPYTCVADIGACNSSTIRACLPGNRYYVQGCLNSQPRVYDCVAMGGRCAGNGCIELPEGADCETDAKASLKYLVCDTGLKCHNDVPFEEFGTCIPK